jgi:hypothetical protein
MALAQLESKVVPLAARATIAPAPILRRLVRRIYGTHCLRNGADYPRSRARRSADSPRPIQAADSLVRLFGACMMASTRCLSVWS